MDAIVVAIVEEVVAHVECADLVTPTVEKWHATNYSFPINIDILCALANCRRNSMKYKLQKQYKSGVHYTIEADTEAPRSAPRQLILLSLDCAEDIVEKLPNGRGATFRAFLRQTKNEYIRQASTPTRKRKFAEYAQSVTTPYDGPIQVEASVRDRLAAQLGGQTEVAVIGGRIDILTTTEVIEVKRIEQFSHALGQVLVYIDSYPTHQARIHLFHDRTYTPQNTQWMQQICAKHNIALSIECVNFDIVEPKRQGAPTIPSKCQHPTHYSDRSPMKRAM